MTRYRNCFLAFTLFLVASCGVGVGDKLIDTASSPSSPSVTVSGVKANYWQDETIAISFSVANMDRTTVNYSISDLDEGYDFTLDSKAGTFRTVSDQYTDAGEYSYTVTATDGSG
ncbi:putative Ig domain-containing protein, partial [Aequoribacter fuscus]